MPLRVLHVEPAHADPAIEEVAQVDYVDCPDQEAFVRALAAAPYEAVFVRLGLCVDAAALAAAPGLRFVVTPTTGIEHVDEAEQRGLRVISLRDESDFLQSVRSTAEHTWGLLLALTRRLGPAQRDVLDGHWRRGPLLGELNGHTLGVIGHGRLGRMVAGYGAAFHMAVRIFDRDVGALDEVLASDVVSLHLPLAPDTRGFLSAERIARMKRGALLVNTARGELIDEAALLAALEEGRLGGAALDVLAGDAGWDAGPPAGHPLVEYARRHENLILTPHVGGWGRASVERTRRRVAERFVEAVRG